jgi:sugar phosphate isomerase/epimerase
MDSGRALRAPRNDVSQTRDLGAVADMNKILLAPTTIPRAAPLEYIEAAAEAGYDGVGLRLHASPGLPYHPVVGDAPLIRAMKRTLANTGLEVFDIYSFYLRPETDVARFAPALELSAEFGGKYVTVMGDDPDWARVGDNFRRMCETAARLGLVCSVEFAVMRPLATLGQTLKLIAEGGGGNAVICLDPLNLMRSGGKPADLAALDPQLFPYAQISDGLMEPGVPDLSMLGRMGPNQRRLLGEGVMPVAEILDALPPNLPLSVEMPAPADMQVSDREWAKTTLDNTRSFLQRYHHAKG